SQTSQPAMADRVRDCRMGVRTTCPAIAAAAFWMSPSVIGGSVTGVWAPAAASGFGCDFGRAFAGIRIQFPFAEADRLWGHFHQLIIANIGDGLFQSHADRRGQPYRLVLAGGADVGQLLALDHVHFQVVLTAVL